MSARYFQKCPFCYSDAFEYKEAPHKGMLMTPENVIHKDNPKSGNEITCQNCKAKIHDHWLNQRYLRVSVDIV